MQNYPNKTKEMFIVRALEKILGDKDIKRQGQLKKACETAIATLKGTDNKFFLFLHFTSYHIHTAMYRFFFIRSSQYVCVHSITIYLY